MAKSVLQEALPRASIGDVSVTRADDHTLIRATVRDAQAPTGEALRLAQTKISSAVDTDIDLEIAFQQMIQIDGGAATADSDIAPIGRTSD